jgi:hypothetical protein
MKSWMARRVKPLIKEQVKKLAGESYDLTEQPCPVGWPRESNPH